MGGWDNNRKRTWKRGVPLPELSSWWWAEVCAVIWRRLASSLPSQVGCPTSLLTPPWDVIKLLWSLAPGRAYTDSANSDILSFRSYVSQCRCWLVSLFTYLHLLNKFECIHLPHSCYFWDPGVTETSSQSLGSADVNWLGNL